MTVLGEADRLLDTGFARTLSALLSHLPRSRQTLLFSATQTHSGKVLARLTLNEPDYDGVKEEGSQVATPKSLEQHYVVVSLDETPLDLFDGSLTEQDPCLHVEWKAGTRKDW